MPTIVTDDLVFDQATAVGPQLYRMLRTRIIRGHLSAGARLSESAIASDFEVSRQPVREAFIKLAEEGLLEVRPQRGTFVPKISISAVQDARFVREAIEADVVKLLASKPDLRLAAELEKQLHAQKEAVDDAAKFIELDELFHQTLAEAAGKANAWRLIEGLKAQMDRVRYLALNAFPKARLLAQHSAVTHEIGTGDVAGAEAAMRLHLNEITNDLPAITKDNPDFFESSGR